MPSEADHQYIDLAGWFPLGNAEILRELIARHDVRRVLEIGTFCGLSTLFFATCPSVEHVTTVDTFAGSDEAYMRRETVMQKVGSQRDIFERNMSAFGVRHKIEALGLASDAAFALLQKSAEPGFYDLIYIDGSHDEAQVRKDIAHALLLEPHILCGDDNTRFWPGVQKAVRDLLPGANLDRRLWSYLPPTPHVVR